MIPGDIDLTEKLDFRNIVKRKVPQLPSTWKKKEILSSDCGSISSSSYINNFEYHIEVDSTRTTSNYFYINDNYTNLYNTTFTSTHISTSTTYHYIVNNNTSIKILYKNYENTIDEYDVFGNKKDLNNKEIPRIPWNNKKINIISKNIPWEKCSSIFNFNSYDIKYAPWDIDKININSVYEDNIDVVSKFGRAKNLISWLHNQKLSFIEDYLGSDNYLSYLTNMSWIRVKDVIID